MKVLFLSLWPIEVPTTRFRMCQYFPYFERCGVKCELNTFLDSEGKKIISSSYSLSRKLATIMQGYRKLDLLKDKIDNYDAVFISRNIAPFSHRSITNLFKQRHTPLIYDFDDAIFIPETKMQSIIKILRHHDSILDLIRISRVVIAGNKNYLLDFAKTYNKNVVYIPSVVDTSIYKPTNREGNKKEIILGWIGSHSTIKFLGMLDDVLNELSGKYDIQLFIASDNVFMLNKFLNLKNINFNSVEWELERDPEYFRGIDIGLYPIPENSFTRGKCGQKIIQYMATGVSCVASAVGANKYIIKDGENGFLCSNRKEWVEKISLLIESPQLRDKFSKAGRKTVEGNFSVLSNLDKYMDIFNSILTSR